MVQSEFGETTTDGQTDRQTADGHETGYAIVIQPVPWYHLVHLVPSFLRFAQGSPRDLTNVGSPRGRTNYLIDSAPASLSLINTTSTVELGTTKPETTLRVAQTRHVTEQLKNQPQ